MSRPFLAIITDFNNSHSRLPMRAFRHADAAREWVDQVHALLCADIDNNKSDDYVETAFLYRIAKNGRCIKIDEFSGLDRGDGLAGGWELECSWRHAEGGWGCSRSRMKNKTVCGYHSNPKNQSYCAGEEGLFAGTHEPYYKNERARIARLRADIKDDPSPLSGLFLKLVKRA